MSRRKRVAVAWFLASAIAPLALAGVETDAVRGTRVTLEFVRGGLGRIVNLVSAPGDDRTLYAVEANGRILALDIDDPAAAPRVFLDIRDRVRCCNEQGLLGLAFHPSFVENGEFFVDYTARTNDASACQAKCRTSCVADTLVSRFHLESEDPSRADADSEEVLLRVGQPFPNHNAGQIAFGPFDEYLYIALGDGGSGGDPCGSGQDPTSFLGKILRIDVDGSDPGKAYAIPAENPFVETEGVLPEIWALGLRNPWRFAFDAATGDLFIADVGQDAWEEIDWEPGGSAGGFNYEWRVREGNHSFNAGTSFGPGTRRGPVHEYPHSGASFTGCSVTGGEVYRGSLMPDLHGTYFFVDFCTVRVGSFRIQDGVRVDLRDRTADWNAGIRPAHTLQNVSTFGTGPRGEIWVAALAGELYQIVPAPDPNFAPVARISREPDTASVSLDGGEAVVTLDASESDDGDGGVQELGVFWEILSGPDAASIESPDAMSTEVLFTATGTWVIRLTVDDGEKQASVETTIEVEPGDDVPRFRRADTNADGVIDISDGVFNLLYLFAGGSDPVCLDAADADDNGEVELTDAVAIFEWLFRGGPDPASPLGECGVDPTPDDALACETQPACSDAP